jgi:hypothetical protein
MPLKLAQATDKQAVFDEIKRQYPGASGPGRIWRIENFNWRAPSEGFLAGIKPLEKIEVTLTRVSGNKNQVKLVDARKNTTTVGDITEG